MGNRFVTVALLWCCGTAFGNIQDQSYYIESTDIVFDGSTYYEFPDYYEPGKGGLGYKITEAFQLNLCYQEGTPNSQIDNFNMWQLPDYPSSDLNFPDGWDCYYFEIDPSGGLPVSLWRPWMSEGESPTRVGIGSGSPSTQWTINGWWNERFHTIMAGDIVNGNFLRLSPARTYRVFPEGREFPDNQNRIAEMLGYLYNPAAGRLEVVLPEHTLTVTEVDAPPEAQGDMEVQTALDAVATSTIGRIDGTLDLGAAAAGGAGLEENTVVLPNTVALDDNDVQAALVAIADTGVVDPYITVKLTYTDLTLLYLGLASESELRPYWWDDMSGTWLLGGTTTAGTQGASDFAGVNVEESAYGLGYCGLNTVENYAWVKVNHASDYGLAAVVPEPATLVLLGLGSMMLVRRRNRPQPDTPSRTPAIQTRARLDRSGSRRPLS